MERPKPRARKARRPQQHANETRNATARTGRKRGIQPMKPSAATQPVRDRPDKMQTHHIHQLQTIPSADVCQKLLNTAPERKESTQVASTHTQTASSCKQPCGNSGVLARARGQKRVANYDEIGQTATGRDRERKGRCT